MNNGKISKPNPTQNYYKQKDNKEQNNTFKNNENMPERCAHQTNQNCNLFQNKLKTSELMKQHMKQPFDLEF